MIGSTGHVRHTREEPENGFLGTVCHGFRVTLEMTGDMVETGLLTSEGKGIGRDSVGF
jgi:hypothetical protein